MLTAGGALPARDEELARAGKWLSEFLGTIDPAPDRKLVQATASAWPYPRRHV